MRSRTFALLTLAMIAAAGCAAPAEPSTPDAVATERPLGPPGGVREVPRDALPPTPTPSTLPPGVVVHRAGGRLAEAPSFGGAPPTFAAIPIEQEAWEPTIGVDPDGRVYYGAVTNALREQIVDGVTPTLGTIARPMVSDDGGRSWSARVPVTAGRPSHAYAADPFLHVDPITGRVFVSDLYAGCTWLSSSDDAGRTWRTNPVACGMPANDHQSVFTGAAPDGIETDGYANVVYLCSNNFANAIACARSLDGGATFEPGAIVAAQPTEHPDVSPSESCARVLHTPDGGVYSPVPSGIGAVAPDGTAYLPWSYCGAFLLGVSRDAGETWENVEVARDLPMGFTHDPTVAVDAAGHIHAFWIDAEARPRLAASRDRGATWSESRDVGVPGLLAATFPAITAGTEGRVAFAYYGTMDARDEGARWHAYVGMTLDALADDPVFAAARATPADDPIAMGTCEGRCPGDPGVGDFIGMAHDPRTGRVWVALADMCYAGQCPPTEQGHGARATVGVQTGGTGLIALTSAAGSPSPRG